MRERLLGGTVPDLPISVDAQLPNDPHKTLRQRMEVTKQSYCWQCHQKMNPLGLTFENFDGFGRSARRNWTSPWTRAAPLSQRRARPSTARSRTRCDDDPQAGEIGAVRAGVRPPRFPLLDGPEGDA